MALIPVRPNVNIFAEFQRDSAPVDQPVLAPCIGAPLTEVHAMETLGTYDPDAPEDTSYGWVLDHADSEPVIKPVTDRLYYGVTDHVSLELPALHKDCRDMVGDILANPALPDAFSETETRAAAAGAGDTMSLFSRFLIPGSETVKDGAAALARGTDYAIDYETAVITFISATTDPPQVSYHYFPLATVYGSITYERDNGDGTAATVTRRLQPGEYAADSASLTLKAGIVSDHAEGTTATLKATYAALRSDLNGTLIRAEDLRGLVLEFGAPTAANPLVFGMAKSLEASTDVVTGTPVDFESSADISRFLEFLEQQEIFSIVPFTRDRVLLETVHAHVAEMNDEAKARWRVLIASPGLAEIEQIIPTAGYGSGGFLDDADEGALSGAVTDYRADLTLENSANIDAVRTTDKVEIIGGPARRGIFDITAVDPQNGVVTVETPWLAASGPDETVFYRIIRRNSKADQAENMANYARSNPARTRWLQIPDLVEVLENTNEIRVPGYYRCALTAGAVSCLPPHQGMTNLAVPGITQLFRAGGYFTASQIDTMMKAGLDIAYQDQPGNPIKSLRQLTTCLDSIEEAEQSGVRVVIFVKKLLYLNLKELLGIHNVNLHFIDRVLRPKISAILNVLLLQRFPRLGPILTKAEILSITIDPDFSDRIRVRIRIDSPSPMNQLDITLLVV